MDLTFFYHFQVISLHLFYYIFCQQLCFPVVCYCTIVCSSFTFIQVIVFSSIYLCSFANFSLFSLPYLVSLTFCHISPLCFLFRARVGRVGEREVWNNVGRGRQGRRIPEDRGESLIKKQKSQRNSVSEVTEEGRMQEY